jgi:REP element-mobilizing transposase RayT
MPRLNPPYRTDCPYHVTARTNNREWFGLDLSEVWKIFEEQLYFIHHGFGVRIHAFVLMGNHFHLLLSDPEGKMSVTLRWLLTETAKEINRQMNSKNHVYGQRNYRSLVESYHYYTHAYKYIYRNPVEAGICTRVEEYTYSSLPGLFGLQKLNFPISDSLLTDDLEKNLNWLNRSTEKKDRETIRQGLKRPVFKLRMDPVSRKESRLESELY